MATFNISDRLWDTIAWQAVERAAQLGISANVTPIFSAVDGKVEHGAVVEVFGDDGEALRLLQDLREQMGLGCAWWDSVEHVGCSKLHPRLQKERSGPPADMVDGRHNTGWPL
jgi:hypothetical protein